MTTRYKQAARSIPIELNKQFPRSWPWLVYGQSAAMASTTTICFWNALMAKSNVILNRNQRIGTGQDLRRLVSHPFCSIHKHAAAFSTIERTVISVADHTVHDGNRMMSNTHDESP